MKTENKKSGHIIGAIIIVLVLVLLAAGTVVMQTRGKILDAYDAVGEDAAALPVVTVLDTPLTPQTAAWQEEIFATLPATWLYRTVEGLLPDMAQKDLFLSPRCDEQPAAFTPQQKSYTVTLADVPGAQSTALLHIVDDAGTVVYDGALSGSYQRTFTQSGTDTCTLSVETSTGTGAGNAGYSWQVGIEVEPTVEIVNDTPVQGEVVAVLVHDNVFAEPMTLETELGLCDFVPLDVEKGEYAAYVPVAYNRTPGNWNITVTLGETQEVYPVTVTQGSFTVQYMTIDEDIADSTWNSATASAEYRSTIYPLYQLTDNEKYWDGLFIEPVTGYRVSTEYGLWRYTNGVLSERHSGVDLACALGTPVHAPQNGVVLYAGYLQMTGNTVVIAHGGGVKSMYYHMDSLNVATGDTVSTGDKIGEVGTTGYSTGPHLHFEVKIGSQSIDPFALFDGTSYLYAGQEIDGI